MAARAGRRLPFGEKLIAATRTHPVSSIPSSGAAGTTSSHPEAARTFADLGTPAALVAALARAGIANPVPIQSASLPQSLAGHDVLGCGRTGSGKTYAFLLPVLARLTANPKARCSGRPRALILAPTRELASQIDTALAPLARAVSLTSATVYGGTSAAPQIKALRAGVDIVVACPGRLEDHVRSGHANLSNVEVTVLDEADHMADLGFLPAVKRLLDQTQPRGQRLLFSATLDTAVDGLAKRYLHNPVRCQVDPIEGSSSDMTHHVLHVDRDDRLPVIVDLTSAPGRTLVFTRTRHGAKKLTKQLKAAGVPAVELHGDLSQAHRTRNLSSFARGHAPTLVATDIAARGIHVDDVQLVVHADPPAEHKAYTHRSGRTARAGATGTVVTIAFADQLSSVRSLTKRAGIKPRVARIDAADPLLEVIAPGRRVLHTVAPTVESSSSRPPRRKRPTGSKPGQPQERRRRPGTGHSAADLSSRGGSARASAGYSSSRTRQRRSSKAS